MDNKWQLLEARNEIETWEKMFKFCVDFYGPDHYKTAFARGGLTAAKTMFQIMGGQLNENQKTDENI